MKKKNSPGYDFERDLDNIEFPELREAEKFFIGGVKKP
jgi:hypothetical protein